MHYKDLRHNILRCELCPHYCLMRSGEQGKCRSRENVSGKLIATNYARAIGLSLDPIEKKPLYHFRPGSKIVSLGPNSCNLACRFCQNYSISQFESPTRWMDLDDLHRLIGEYSSLRQVAFTYTEPLTWYEYIYDFATRYPDTDVVLISNGFINPAPLAELLPHIKALNIDLKSGTKEFYEQECGGKQEPVLNSIQLIHAAGVHLELTYLLIPGLNDSKYELEWISSFMAKLSPDMPLHISAYHPDYKMDIPPTTADDIARAVTLARKSLNYVYGGNIPLEDLMQTACPDCGTTVIQRGFGYCTNHLDAQAKCPMCGRAIYGVFDHKVH